MRRLLRPFKPMYASEYKGGPVPNCSRRGAWNSSDISTPELKGLLGWGHETVVVCQRAVKYCQPTLERFKKNPRSPWLCTGNIARWRGRNRDYYLLMGLAGISTNWYQQNP